MFFFYSRPANDFYEPINYAIKSKNILLKTFIGFYPIAKITFKLKFLRNLFWTLKITERIVENPFVFQQLQLPIESKILDIGCSHSKISLQLSSLGYRVTGVDLRDYCYKHPNFEFIKGNILDIKLQENHFDGVIMVSTLEHIGLPEYGEPAYKIDNIDEIIMEKIYYCMKPGGVFILTVPFLEKIPGKKIYNYNSIKELLKKFTIEKMQCYESKQNKYWEPYNGNLNNEPEKKHFVICIKSIKK